MIRQASLHGLGIADHPRRRAFLKWQCRVRQLAMREADGRPDDAITPALTLPGATAPMGHVITVLNRSPGYEVTSELRHIFARTNDPAQRRQSAIEFLSSAYYQKAAQFSDILTATFLPDSQAAGQIRAAQEVTLTFDAYAQRFDLVCRVWRLGSQNPLHAATMAHNALFNPTLHPDSIVLGFEPDWARSAAEPDYG